MNDRLRVGTRRSPLARAQTELVLEQLTRRRPSSKFETVALHTSGDRDRSIGSSPDFTDALDRALLEGEVDLAVHSAKDLPLVLDPKLELAATPRRADPRDCLVTARGGSLNRLPPHARVGSSSLRRRAQLLRARPDLTVVEIRGNVDTRVALVRSGRIDAAVLAKAGLERLGRRTEIAQVLPSTRFVPPPAQGCLAVVIRASDRVARATVEAIEDRSTRARVAAERAFAATLGGDCQVPLGALATHHGGRLTLLGEVLSADGRTSLRIEGGGAAAHAVELGERLGRRLIERGATDLIAPAPG